MSIIQAIKDFWDSIFRSNSPEVQKRLSLRKLENELRESPSMLYKNELVQPNFAEALRILFVNTRPIAKILENTISSSDIRRNSRFEQELIITAYSAEDRQLLDSLSYEARKKALFEADSNSEHRILEAQRSGLEKIVADTKLPQFAKMDEIITHLKQLTDLCHFNYIVPLQLFDGDFAEHYNDENFVPQFLALPAATLENTFLDLYYLTADFTITLADGNAILALNQLLNGKENDSRTKKEIMQNLRRIQAVIKKILDAKTLKNLICLAKGDSNFVPQRASYSENVCRNFIEKIQRQFQADEQHIRNEMKDNYVKHEIMELFPDGNIETLNGYNRETMDILGGNSTTNFMWVVPMQILKTFFKVYYAAPLRSLLNDIIVEGLFSNAAKKTAFSQMIFSINEGMNLIDQFENEFNTNGRFGMNLIKGYINDSHKDVDFGKRLSNLVDNINAEAKEIIQKLSTLLYSLSDDLEGFLQDSKRSTSEIVTNLKGIMFSSRNREATSLLELQFPLWKNFFEIIKNYVIIKRTKKE